MPTVAALLYPEALATSVTLPLEILQAATQLARARRHPVPAASLRLLSLEDTGSVTLSAGLALPVHGRLATLEAVDLLILPAIWRHPRRVLARIGDELPRLRRLHDRGARICSVGSAANILAAAGLLDGRPATTHWRDFEAFSRRHPQVQLKRRHLITRSGRLYCVGSVNSIGDFTVHMVSLWYGAAIARSVEVQFSPEARQSFTSAAFLDESPDTHQDALVRDLQDQLQRELGDAHSLAGLARRCGLTARSLGRRFRNATGRSPMAWLREQRLQEARALLQHSDLPVGEIAWRCGFSSASRFAGVFREAHGMSPRHWRSAVRGKRFSAGDAGAADAASRDP